MDNLTISHRSDMTSQPAMPPPAVLPPADPTPALLDAARKDRSYASFYDVWRKLEKSGVPAAGIPLKVALLGNTTLDHVKPYLEVQLRLAGFAPRVYVAPFGQIRQEILNPRSGLHAHAPDMVVLMQDARELLGELYDFPLGSEAERRARADEVLETLLEDVHGLLARPGVRVVVHDLLPPPIPLLGILDNKEPYGCDALIRDLNQRLEDRLRPLDRAYLMPASRALSRVGWDQSSPEKRRLIARITLDRAALPLLAEGWERYARAFCMPARKVLVLDLDNTLWGGVIGEDGVQGIRLGHDAPGNSHRALQEVALQLSRRGVVLAICSKNNLEDALGAIQGHPEMVLREQHFAAIRCNWQEKSQNIRDIARELSLGLDSFVFVDDNPVERAKVREALPEVLVVDLPEDPTFYARTVASLTCFETPQLTQEDRNRGQLYVQRRMTEDLRAQSSSLEAFYESLQTVLTAREVDPMSLGRSAQLLARTNQFNMTTRRHSDAVLQSMQQDGRHVLLSISLRDRFGDQGQVGLVILETPAPDLTADSAADSAAVAAADASMASAAHAPLLIESFVLSCRVLGRGVEQAILHLIAQLAQEKGATRLQAPLIYSKKNAPARDLYRESGFQIVAENAEGILFTLDLAKQTLSAPQWMTIER